MRIEDDRGSGSAAIEMANAFGGRNFAATQSRGYKHLFIANRRLYVGPFDGDILGFYGGFPVLHCPS
jgi:hypothetical protein